MKNYITKILACLFISSTLFNGVYAKMNPKVIIETSKGNIEIELYQTEAPETVKNFINYASSGFYNDTIFHRVIKGFMIQGGGLTEDMQNKETDKPIKNEATNGLSNKRGTIAMARTSEPHSASSQFFINHKDNDVLDFKDESPNGWGYCVFGIVVSGLDIVDEIANVETGNYGPYSDVPKDVIQIISVKISE